jgi:ACS family tartrate transporter-like MFS transporter
VDTRAPTVRGVDPIERETIHRVFWRLMPLLMLGMFCAYLDRSNVGMAAPTMRPDLGFSNAVFGFGAGLFFLGYFLAEIPSNLILNQVGARRWIARIMITWGIVSGLTAFVWNDWSFYGARFVLGLAEAGFGPGVILYLIWWFPSAYRTRAMALFQSAATVSLILGPPIGGLLLHLHGLLGLAGWQWLFITEAVPAVIMCVVIWVLLTDKPADAAWLRPDQKAWLVERLAAERTQRESIRKFTLVQAFANPKVLALTLAYMGQTMVGYGLVFFLPLIVKNLGVSTDWIGTVSAVPYVFAFAAMLFWGWHSDVTGERTWHVAGPFLLAAAGLATCAIIGVGHPVLVMIALIFAIVGQQVLVPIFWSIPSALLTGTAAAGGIAMINSIGNLGGWFGPSVFGLVKDATGSDTIGLLSLAAAPVIAAIAIVAVGHDRRLERIPPRS